MHTSYVIVLVSRMYRSKVTTFKNTSILCSVPRRHYMKNLQKFCPFIGGTCKRVGSLQQPYLITESLMHFVTGFTRRTSHRRRRRWDYRTAWTGRFGEFAQKPSRRLMAVFVAPQTGVSVHDDALIITCIIWRSYKKSLITDSF